MPRTDEMFPDVASSEGLRCCGTTRAWRDMPVRIIECEWCWYCPVCGELIRVDPFRAPADEPVIRQCIKEAANV